MGITKIKPVKDSLSRIVGYAENPEKTGFSDMQQVLHYADDHQKVGVEQTMYVTGIHCRREHITRRPPTAATWWGTCSAGS